LGFGGGGGRDEMLDHPAHMVAPVAIGPLSRPDCVALRAEPPRGAP